jgi:hypothetical protein
VFHSPCDIILDFLGSAFPIKHKQGAMKSAAYPKFRIAQTSKQPLHRKKKQEVSRTRHAEGKLALPSLQIGGN